MKERLLKYEFMWASITSQDHCATTGRKIQFIKFYISNCKIAKIKCRQKGGLGAYIVVGSNKVQKCADVIYGWPPAVIIGPIWKCNCKLRVATCSNKLYIPIQTGRRPVQQGPGMSRQVEA